MACANPKNQMLYQALLNKAASYPASQPYKAKAYKKAAESISNCPFDLQTKEHPEDIFFIGPSIAKYIKDFNNHACPTCPLAEVPKPPIIQRQVACGSPVVMPQCKVPANQPIYEALLAKAASYPADQPYQAKAYKKVAESVLTHTWDINEIARKGTWWQGEGQHVPGIGGSTLCFISDFVRCAPTIAPVAPARPTGGVSSAQLRPLADDNSAEDDDETEEETETILIPASRTITVQKLIETLQAAIKNNPTVAAMPIEPYIYEEGNNSAPYKVTIDAGTVFITTCYRNSY
jgi:hypothetical protein